VNAEGATVGGAQGDNVYASYGGMINLDGHSATVTFTTASVNGQNINIDGGIVTRQNKIVTDNLAVQNGVVTNTLDTDNLNVNGIVESDGYNINGSPLDSNDVGAVDDSQFPDLQFNGSQIDDTDTINFIPE
jgi:hypothetical protein